MVELIKEKIRYYYKENLELIAEINFRIENNTMYIDRTYTNENYRGKGYAKKLLNELVNDAKSKNYKIEPICSFAIYELNKTN